MTADPAAPPPVRHPRALPVLLAVTLVGVVLDQVTKLIALEVLEPGRFVPLIGDAVGWQLVFNPGAAFGLPVPPPAFLVVGVLVVVIVVRSLPHTSSLLQITAYGLLLAGAVGNLIDRVVYAEDGFLTGEVVDFVAWGSFPRFNVADACITVGFALLVVALLVEERRVAAEERAQAADVTDGGADEATAAPTADPDERP